MLNSMNLQYITTPISKGALWKKGFVLFAWLKNHMENFTKARKGSLDMRSDAKHVDLLKAANITKDGRKSVLQNMKDGQKETQRKFWQTSELIITGIKKRFLKSSKNPERSMDMPSQRHIGKKTRKRLHVTTMCQWQSNLAILSVLNHAITVKFIVNHMLTTMTTQSRWKLSGFVEYVMGKSIEQIFQRERLSLETAQADAIVQTTEETCREKFEVISPPRNRSVSKLLLKVIEWLRHTAGCSFYQGQCITNDLWMQNLRSTGI